jgi:hypothetical protein
MRQCLRGLDWVRDELYIQCVYTFLEVRDGYGAKMGQ